MNEALRVKLIQEHDNALVEAGCALDEVKCLQDDDGEVIADALCIATALHHAEALVTHLKNLKLIAAKV